MKKLLSMGLMLLLLVCVCAGASAEESQLPQVGDVVSGFEVVEVTDFPLIGADVVYFQHQKTGAELIYLANEDTNRVFDLTFRIAQDSETGAPHVLEHITLDGSEKYPSRDLFFNLSYQTYGTYLNASTDRSVITYPVASLSEEQLLKYADFYTDSCLHPMIYQDASLFSEEAWRYSLNDAEDELTLSGTVYSEMQGAYDLNTAAYTNFCKTLFPGASASYENGGTPKEIPNLTYQAVVDYHSKYFHPSNAICFLYGNFAHYERFLSLLDGYFSEYDKVEVSLEEENYTPITEAQTKAMAYGVESTSSTERMSTIYYGIRCDGVDEETRMQLMLLPTLLQDATSPIYQRIRTELPSATFGCYVIVDMPEPAITFRVDGVNPEDAETFRKAVDEGLQEIVENGFDRDAAEAIIAADKISNLLVTEESDLGVNIVTNIAYYWSTLDDWHCYMDFCAYIDRFEELFDSGVFTDVIARYLTDSPYTALVTTYPQAGLKEEEDAALKAHLAEVKAAMTDEEIAAVVAQTQALAEESDSDAAEYVAQLQAVTVETLPEETRLYNIKEEAGEDGVRHIDVNANATGVGMASLMLDMADLPQEYLHWLQLYIDLLCEVDSTSHTYTQLVTLANRYLYGGVIKLSVPYQDEAHAFLRATWTALDEEMQAGYDLVGELLFDSQFTDAQRISEAVSSLKTSKRSSINGESYMLQLTRAGAAYEQDTRMYTYVTDLAYYEFLGEVEQLLQTEPQTVLNALQSVQSMVNNRTNAISAFVGSEESAANHRAIADAFLEKMNVREMTSAEYDLPVPSMREALAINSSVMFNLIYADWETLGCEAYTGDWDAVTALVNDLYLLPMLRDQYGVYSVFSGADANGLYMLTYRDPNVQETYDVYAKIPELVASCQIDQETLNGYIISSYSYLAMPQGELTGGQNAFLNYLSGISQEEKLDWMRQLKGLKAEDVNSYAEAYQRLVNNGIRSTSGSAAAIAEKADLFDAVLSPFAIAGAAEGFEDCAKDSPLYEAVTFAYENGLMDPLSDTAFGVDEPATLGDLASMCYVLVGGGLVPDEAIAYLNQFGIVPDAPADTQLNRTDVVYIMDNFFYSTQLPVDEAELPAFDDADQVEEGMEPVFGWALNLGLVKPLTETTLGPNELATRGQLAELTLALVTMLDGME